MRQNSSLSSRLDVLEAQLISPLQERIDALSPSDRATYDHWKQQCHDQFQRYRGEPGKYFAAWLNGEIVRPELPQHIYRQLFPSRLTITDDMSLADVSDRYRQQLEQLR